MPCACLPQVGGPVPGVQNRNKASGMHQPHCLPIMKQININNNNATMVWGMVVLVCVTMLGVGGVIPTKP